LKKIKYTVGETFVGAGGSHLGFKNAGFETLFINDINPDCLKTILHNNKELNSSLVFDDSILELNGKKIKKSLKKDLDVLFGGIVCKGFSLAGEKSPNDPRNYFYRKQINLVKDLKPKISIIENVPGMKNAKVIDSDTPLELKKEIDWLWKELNNLKGIKAANTKNNIDNLSVDQKRDSLRIRKEKILSKLKDTGMLITVLEDIYKLYQKIGYNVYHKVLNSAWYGSGTKRNRLIIVAVRKDLKGEFKFPAPTHYTNGIGTLDDKWKDIVKKLPKCKTVGECLEEIDYSLSDVDNLPMNHNPKTVKRFTYIPEGESIAKHIDSLPDDLKISKFYSRGNTMRLSRSTPSPTLVPGHSNFPVHPVQHRSITVREAATISGFPLDYKFFGSHSKRCEHVGNAVPPDLAEAIAKSCKIFFETNLK
jgi:DNA (cytosine-5)-methyltransferase 1